MKEKRSKSLTKIEKFQKEREKLNKRVMKYASLKMKKFYSLDTQAYLNGLIPKKTKELLGLVASFVLRCDDCIRYHLIRCHKEGISDGELEEVLNIGLIVGGSVTIPNLRRAFETWRELKKSTRIKK